jgi:hypothetical protein
MTGVKQAAEGGTASSEQSATEQTKERVQDTAQQVGQKAEKVRAQAAGRMRQELDTRSTQGGEQVSTAADAVRRVGEQLRNEGDDRTARYADEVAERIERLGSYLTHANADRMLRDVENFARRRPWLVAVGGAAIGFLASRFVKASSANRYQLSQAGNGTGSATLPRPSRDPAMTSSGEPGMATSSMTGGRSEGRGDL